VMDRVRIVYQTIALARKLQASRLPRVSLPFRRRLGVWIGTTLTLANHQRNYTRPGDQMQARFAQDRSRIDKTTGYDRRGRYGKQREV
jgi:hypothetical protein